MLGIFNTRTVRLLLALIIVVSLASVAATRVLYETSIEAVVNAPRMQIAAPTDGVLGDFHVTPGGTVRRGAPLFNIRRDNFSRGTQEERGAQMQSVRERVSALEAQITGLRGIRDSLKLRVKSFREAMLVQLQASTAAAEARAEERHKNQVRVSALRGADGSTAADEERARTDAVVATAEAGFARASLEAAKRGIVTSPGSADVPYSQQRVDELAIQLTNLVAELTVAAAELREVERTTSALGADTAVDGTIQIRANVDGVVWATPFSDGAQVTKGTNLLTLIDCSKLYLDATVSPREQDHIKPGAKVRLRFAGTSVEFPGVIAYVRGGGVREDGTSAAQLTLDSRRDDSHAIINVDAATIGASPGNFCQVGRSAKVTFDGPDFSAGNTVRRNALATVTANVRAFLN